MMKLQCPKCGNVIDYDENRDFMFCQFCGTAIQIKSDGTIHIADMFEAERALAEEERKRNSGVS